MFREDVRRCYDLAEGGRAGRLVTCFASPGLRTIAVFRASQWARSLPAVARILLAPVFLLANEHMKSAWGIAIGRNATIGPGFYIGHHGGIVISSGAVLGRNCSVSQGVTIGVSGSGQRRGCPRIGDDVYVAPGAKLFGPITIGSDVKIGANAVVHRDVPSGETVVAPESIALTR